MSMQARFNQFDQRLYSPSRDVAHNFAFVAKQVAKKLEEGTWKELDELLSANKIDFEKVAEAFDCFVNFVMSAQKPEPDGAKQRSMREHLEACGWFNCDPLAQIAVSSMLGCVTMGVYFYGVREASVCGYDPLSTAPELAECGAKLIAYVREKSNGRARVRGEEGVTEQERTGSVPPAQDDQ